MGKYQVHRSDTNQQQIVDAWRRVGAAVELIGRPVDALVAFRGVNYLVEIKTPRGHLRASQKAFLDRWPGQVAVVRSVAEGLKLIGATR